MPPTATYAIPRKGFFPPITVRVEMTKVLVPPYFVTGKSVIISSRQHKAVGRHTTINIHLIHATFHSLVIITLCQLAEVGEAGSPHPDLESIVLI